MSTNISSTTRYLKFSYISILTSLLGTDNETRSGKTIYNIKNAIKYKRKNTLCTSKTKNC